MELLIEPEISGAIIGAILGGIIGIGGSAISYIISNAIQNRGKLILFSNRSKVEYFGKNDDFGQPETIENVNMAEDIFISVDIDLLNTSNAPKVLGEFKIELKSANNTKVVLAKKFERTSSGMPYSEPVITTVALPKQNKNIKCDGHLQKNDFNFSESKIEISLLFRTNKKKLKRLKVIDINKEHL